MWETGMAAERKEESGYILKVRWRVVREKGFSAWLSGFCLKKVGVWRQEGLAGEQVWRTQRECSCRHGTVEVSARIQVIRSSKHFDIRVWGSEKSGYNYKLNVEIQIWEYSVLQRVLKPWDCWVISPRKIVQEPKSPEHAVRKCICVLLQGAIVFWIWGDSSEPATLSTGSLFFSFIYSVMYFYIYFLSGS